MVATAIFAVLSWAYTSFSSSANSSESSPFSSVSGLHFGLALIRVQDMDDDALR